MSRSRRSLPPPTRAEATPSLPSIVDEVSITNPRFSSGVSANAPVDELIAAAAGLDQLCLFADWSGIPDGTRWDGVWYIDVRAITEFSTIDDRWSFGEDGRNFWMCAIDPGAGLKVGVYEVALFLNEEFAFAEAIVLSPAPVSVHPATWVNATGVDLCGFAVNPRTDSRQVGANELTSGEVIASGGEVTLQIAEGTVIAEAYACDGELVATISTGNASPARRRS